MPQGGALPHPRAVRVGLDDLARAIDRWVPNRRARSPQTRELRRHVAEKFLWYLRAKGHESCGADEIEDFLTYLEADHAEGGGRWGKAHLTGGVRPQTVLTYYSYLRALFNSMAKDGRIPVSPVLAVTRPEIQADQIQPFTEEEVERLFAAAKRSRHPKRDIAILYLLYDTGIRASELCGITYGDLDLENNAVTVLGKGSKRRTVYYAATTFGALWDYVYEDVREKPSKRDYRRSGQLPAEARPPRKLSEPVFRGDRQMAEGNAGALTRSGLLQLMERLGAAAGVTKKRCSPHTWRHTFAVTFLRNGGNTFTLQQILGHTSLAMTRRYVQLAEADIESQQHRFSPVEALRSGRGGR